MWFVIKFENYVDIYDIIQYFSTKKKKKNTTSGVFGFPKFPRCCHTTIYKCKHNQKFLYESKICKVKSSIICRPTWTTSKDFHNSNWQLLGNEEKVHSFHTPFFFFFFFILLSALIFLLRVIEGFTHCFHGKRGVFSMGPR